ncbi:hypothetical protein ACLOJK_036001 [Asimina triloba]
MSYYNQQQPPVGVPPPQGTPIGILRKGIPRTRIRRQATLRRDIRNRASILLLSTRRLLRGTTTALLSLKDGWVIISAGTEYGIACLEKGVESLIIRRSMYGRNLTG